MTHLSARRNTYFVIAALGLLAMAGAAAQESPADDPLAAKGGQLWTEITQARTEIDELKEQFEAAEGEEQVLVERQLMRKKIEALGQVHALADNIVAQEKADLDTAALRAELEPLMRELPASTVAHIEEFEASVDERRSAMADLAPEERVVAQAELDADVEQLDGVYELELQHIRKMEALRLDATEETADLARRIEQRAATSAERLRLAMETIAALSKQAGKSPDNAEIQAELQANVEKMNRMESSLSRMTVVLKEMGLDSSEYQQLLFQVSGEVTTDILDKEVALGLAQQWVGQGRDWIVSHGPQWIFKLLLFALILGLFKLLAISVRKVLKRSFASSKLRLSMLLQNMITKMAGNVIMILGLLVALSQMGLSLAPLLAGLGVAGFIVGFALQNTLSNFASGVMILFYRPFDVGDLIEAGGVFGRVNHMSLVSTTFLTLDNQTLVVPNNLIWDGVIKNVTSQQVRRVDLTFGISYNDDIPRAEEVLKSILADHEKVLDDPAPIVRLHNLGESSVDFVVRPWVKTDDYWDVHWDVTREVKMRFDAEGISIPFPQRDVHVVEQTKISA